VRANKYRGIYYYNNMFVVWGAAGCWEKKESKRVREKGENCIKNGINCLKIVFFY